MVTSAAVLVEVIHPRNNDSALKWTLSRLRVEPVPQALAQSAATLLRAAGLLAGGQRSMGLDLDPGRDEVGAQLLLESAARRL